MAYVIARATAALPFLSWPIIGPLFALLVTKLGELAYKAVDELIDLTEIKWKNRQTREAYDYEMAVIRQLQGKANLTNEEAENALTNLEKKLGDAIQYRPQRAA